MRVNVKNEVLLTVNSDELDIVIRGLQLIEWQDGDANASETMAAKEMKSDLIAIRNQIEMNS